MHNVIKCARYSGLDLFLSSRDTLKESCPSYYIKGLCNARCGRAGYHHPYPAEGDRALIEWSNKANPGGKGDGGGVK